MEFGILFTSHPNAAAEPYPHRDVHARVTKQIVRADELGYDYAWVAEHHFSNEYGIMPDVFVYAGYLAALTKRIKIGTAVVTLPLANPLRVAENSAFIDILTGGRFVLGLGSGYRKYEFDALRRGLRASARHPGGGAAGADGIAPCQEGYRPQGQLLHRQGGWRLRAVPASGPAAASADLPRRPRPSARSASPARYGFGTMMSSWTPFPELARQAKVYREALDETPPEWRQNGARGHVDVARWVYVAETDAKAKTRERGRHHEEPRALLQRPHLGLSRDGVEGCRFESARLRRAEQGHPAARLAGERGGRRSRPCATQRGWIW